MASEETVSGSSSAEVGGSKCVNEDNTPQDVWSSWFQSAKASVCVLFNHLCICDIVLIV